MNWLQCSNQPARSDSNQFGARRYFGLYLFTKINLMEIKEENDTSVYDTIKMDSAVATNLVAIKSGGKCSHFDCATWIGSKSEGASWKIVNMINNQYPITYGWKCQFLFFLFFRSFFLSSLSSFGFWYFFFFLSFWVGYGAYLLRWRQTSNTSNNGIA